ncbi:hypothetical protein CHS0354_023918 [Potamilus streckersoni]|uniref:site-specific DNA-methyltransferase (cytosine-N(4)-specific) n=1 Tax=Potamilus streckersoni TaxID=2493646 RepID=A0AAE0VLK7_9BIVA|nr:hypothetical protein CHS0354_023918 [Potamilus streckersoni]
MAKLDTNKIYCGDCNEVLQDIPSNSIDLVITSPPYFQQREYGGGNGVGNEKKVEEYIEIPYRFAIEVQKEKLAKLINELTWVKVNPAPKQDPRKLVSSTEPFFIFQKDSRKRHREKYFELIEKAHLSKENKEQAKKELSEVIREVKEGKLESFRMKIRGIHALPYGGQAGGRLTQIETKGFTIIKIYGNSIRKDVIESTVETIKGNVHPAVYPEFIVQELIKLLTNENDTVLDPFLGSGTTAVVAKRMKRNYIGIEIHSEYIEYAKQRLNEIPSYTLDLFDLLLNAVAILDSKKEIKYPEIISSNVDTLINKIDKNKSLLSALVTSLVKKINEPKQDIRLHRTDFVGLQFEILLAFH